jgi:hypothetical protein
VVWPQNHLDGFLRFGLKIGGDGFLRFGLKTGGSGFWFGPQNRQLRFDYLDLKITAMVSWFGPQNQAGFGWLVAPQNRRREDGVGHTSRSGCLLRLEGSHTWVSQSSLKTGEGATAGGACGTIAEVALGSS